MRVLSLGVILESYLFHRLFAEAALQPPSSRLAARRRAVFAKILFAAIAKPDPEHLRHFLPLRLAETFVKSERLLAFAAAGPVVMSILIAAGHTDAPARLFDQCFADERLVAVFLVGHKRRRWIVIKDLPTAKTLPRISL